MEAPSAAVLVAWWAAPMVANGVAKKVETSVAKWAVSSVGWSVAPLVVTKVPM
jgi:hypothetical protein